MEFAPTPHHLKKARNSAAAERHSGGKNLFSSFLLCFTDDFIFGGSTLLVSLKDEDTLKKR